jgi:hypothetical protein
MNASVLFLIYSREYNAFLREGGHGYTAQLVDAGRFTVDEMLAHCTAANQQPGPDGGANEIAFPAMTAVC